MVALKLIIDFKLKQRFERNEGFLDGLNNPNFVFCTIN
jgi:hypothetical protein